MERRSARQQMVAEAVVALDELALGRDAGGTLPHRTPTAAQRSALIHIESSVAAMGQPPQDLHAAGAFEELRGTPAYEDTPPSLGSFGLWLLSLPPVGSRPVPAEEMVGPALAAEIYDKVMAGLLSQAAVDEKLEAEGGRIFFQTLLFGRTGRGVPF